MKVTFQAENDLQMPQTRGSMDTDVKTAKPPMCTAGHVLVITSAFYRAAQGSAVVMRNLLAQFAPDSFTVVTGTVPARISAPIPPEIRVFTLPTTPPFTVRGERYWRDLCHPYIQHRIKSVVRKVRPALILAVYPSLHMFSAAMNAAEANGVRWVAYLHDELREQYRGTKYEDWAENVESRMFSSAEKVLVTGRGLCDLYRARRSVECVPLEIAYCEAISSSLWPEPAGPPCAFMGGSIYSANHRAMARLLGGAERAGISFKLAMPDSWGNLQRYGIAQLPTVEKVHYALRAEYLAALPGQHILTVGLNWPDECSIAEAELATAFPTKVIEYLAAGRPILVHCPENYFLARFFREHKCGIVVSTRDVGDIEAAMSKLLSERPEVDSIRRNAMRAAQIFSIDRLKVAFSQTLEEAFRSQRVIAH